MQFIQQARVASSVKGFVNTQD